MTTNDDFNAELAEEDMRGRIKDAYHEAGHAVAAHRLGYRLLRVSIKNAPTPADEPKGLVRGYANYDDVPQRHKEPYTISLDKARIATGGIVGVRLHEGFRFQPSDWYEFGGYASTAGAHDDWEEVFHHLDEARTQGAPKTAVESDHRAKARRLLSTRKNRAAVEAIAQALVERETLDGPEAIAVIEQALR